MWMTKKNKSINQRLGPNIPSLSFNLFYFSLSISKRTLKQTHTEHHLFIQTKSLHILSVRVRVREMAQSEKTAN